MRNGTTEAYVVLLKQLPKSEANEIIETVLIDYSDIELEAIGLQRIEITPKSTTDVVIPEPEKKEFDLEIQVTRVLHELGIPAHIKGYQYVRTAIIMCIKNPTLMESVVKELYPAVAKVHDTTRARVERAIRHAIEVAWDRGNPKILDSYFGYTINSSRGKPTNSEFIAMIADNIRLSMSTK